MGFLDKARSSFTDRFGDEVVRKGTFGAREDEAEEFPEEKPAREPKARRQPKPKMPREPKKQKESAVEPEEFQDGAFGSEDDGDGYYEQQDSYDFPDFEEPQVINQTELANLSKDQGESVEEILKSMRIKETFTIDDGILFLDEELANQQFATQAPYGYDMGEVDFFLSKAQRSVAEYVKLLRVRNDDVVKLASRISDILVELNNIRFNSEVANGINIMATGGDDDALAVDLQEARARARSLEDELNLLRQNGVPQAEPGELERLRNDLSAERLSRSAFEKEAQDLRAHLVLIEEEYDIQIFSDQGDIHLPTATSGYDSYEDQRSGQFQQTDGFDRAENELYAEENSYQKVGRDHWLPGLEEEGLPGLPAEEGLPDGSFEFEEEGLDNISIDSFEGADGGFEQSDGSFQNSAFTADPYQNLDEFIEDNLDGFPDDNRSTAAPLDGSSNTTFDDDDPDEDGFEYSFERAI